MRTALDAPSNTLNAYERDFIANVRAHGWFNTSVSGDAENPNFSYSTGLWLTTSQPELIMFGLKSQIAHDVFWDLFRGAQDGRALPIRARTEQPFGNLPAYAFPVAKRFYADYLGSSRWFYGSDDFPCLQIVWPDRAGVFPWEDRFDPEFVSDQPDLTENGWQATLAN
ncbi:MAG: DUF4262 domain-containing protein [Brevundimonas sp.]